MDEALAAHGATLRNKDQAALCSCDIIEGVEGDVLLCICSVTPDSPEGERRVVWARKAIESQLAMGTQAALPRLEIAVADADRVIHDVDAGSTRAARGDVVAVWVIDGIAYAASSGGARAHLIREGTLAGRTKGGIPPKIDPTADAARTASEGFGAAWPLKLGDLLVLSSPPLCTALREEEIVEIARVGTPEAAVDGLLKRASGRGAPPEAAAIVAVFRDPMLDTIVDGVAAGLAEVSDTDAGAPGRSMGPTLLEEATETTRLTSPVSQKPAGERPSSWTPIRIVLVALLVLGAFLAGVAVLLLARASLS